MKNYRGLMPIALAALVVVSWYMLISNAGDTVSEYNNYVAEARKWAEDGITKYAIQNYELALAVDSNADLYVEVADYYKSQEQRDLHLNWCEDFFEKYPTEPKAYDCVLEAYLMQSDYEACYDVIYSAKKRNISTDYIKKVSDEIMYSYSLGFSTFDEVGAYSNNFCAVRTKSSWGFVDRYGEMRIGCIYPKVGDYTKHNMAPVVNSKGDAYYIDKTGAKVKVAKEKYNSLGLLTDSLVAAEKTDGKYVYLSSDLKSPIGDYDYASTMNGGIAAVRNGDYWQIIGSKGSAISETRYADVKLDEKQIAYRNGRMFVATEQGKYIMVDSKCNRIGTLEFEDAMVFTSDAPTAVKLGGKWCFVDVNGNLVSDKKYDGARAFTNGLAAVCINDKWGFVDSGENIVIEPAFDGAKDFNEKGSCFVYKNEKWQLLKLFRLNRA